VGKHSSGEGEGKMSQLGIRKVAYLISQMQQRRTELIGGDNQDMMLAQVLFKWHEAMKEDFTRIVAMDIKPQTTKEKP
jgi:hypothetical protein